MKSRRFFSVLMVMGTLVALAALTGCGNKDVDTSTISAAPPPAADAKPAAERPAGKPMPAADASSSTGGGTAVPAGK